MTRVLVRIRRSWTPMLHWPVVGVAVYLAVAALFGATQGVLTAGALGVAAVRAAAAWTFLQASRVERAEAARRSWRMMATGLGLWAAGAAVGAVVRLAQGGSPPLPAANDLLALAGSLAVLTAMAAVRQPERFGRLRELLDVTILVIAVASLTWLVLVRTALRVELAPPIQVLWSGIAPALDLVAAGLAARHVLRGETRHEAITFGVFMVGALAMAAADLGDGYRRLQIQTLTGVLVEVGWMLGALAFIQVGHRLSERHRSEGSAPRRAAARLETLTPIALTYAVVGTAVVDLWTSGQPDWLVISASAALSLLLMARQGVIAGQIEMRQYAALVNASADLSFICDADGTILLANPAFAYAVGSPSDELAGTDLKGYFSGEQFRLTLEGALSRGWSGEAQLLDGQVPIYLSLRPVRDERRSRPLLAGAGIDLRAIKRRESELEVALEEVASARRDLEQLNSELEFKVDERTARLAETVADLARVNEELKELDRMKSEFVALVSHELRSPLTNIRSGLELVLDRNPQLGPNVGESLSLVHRETKRLSALVETIMDLSALEAGRFPMELQPVEVKAMAREVATQFPGLNRLVMELDEDLPSVTADVNGMKSVLYHLFDNACKYAPEGDLLLQAEPESGSVLISLTDHGPGIPEQDRERVFEMFHRLDSRDSREVYGHGLGLPMARRLIEAMGGEIRVVAAKRGGARFEIRLPHAEGA